VVLKATPEDGVKCAPKHVGNLMLKTIYSALL
jgi:hypothetical protein